MDLKEIMYIEFKKVVKELEALPLYGHLETNISKR